MIAGAAAVAVALMAGGGAYAFHRLRCRSPRSTRRWLSSSMSSW